MLVLTRPDVIGGIHREYLDAGADIIETNTFNAQAISQADYGLEPFCLRDEPRGGASSRARRPTSSRAQTPDQPRFVAGSIGPANRTLSISPDVNNPALRAITFDQLKDAYADQVRGLIDGGVDILLRRDDLRHAEREGRASSRSRRSRTRRASQLPLMISVTITDRSGRTLSGQTLDAFYLSIEHARPWCVGINCALGAREMRPYLAELARLADVLGERVSERRSAERVRRVRRAAGRDRRRCSASSPTSGFANILGGCCGTTPDHIARDRSTALQGVTPRRAARRTFEVRQFRSPKSISHAPLRPRAAHHPPGQQLPDDRRAHERHRLEASSPG